MALRNVLGAVGGVVGAFFGAPQLGYAIGAAVGNAVDPQILKGPAIGDIANQSSQEGLPRPIVFAKSAPMPGNIIASGPPKIKKKRSSGKGGPKVETETVFRTYGIGVCEGPITRFVRVWRNGEIVYDAQSDTNYSSGDVVATALRLHFNNLKFAEKVTFYLGTYDQVADPALEVIFGVGTTPAHRGTAYMVVDNDDLTDLRGAIPQYTFQVERCGVASLISPVATMVAGNDSGSPDLPPPPTAVLGYSQGAFGTYDPITIIPGTTITALEWDPNALSGPSLFFQSAGDLPLDLFAISINDEVFLLTDAQSVAPSQVVWLLGTSPLLTGVTYLISYLRSTEGCSASLVDVIHELCERAGLPVGLTDTALLEDQQVRGFTVTNSYPCTEALRALAQVFFFDPAPYDGLVHFIPRGADYVAIVTDEDMLDDDADIEQTKRADSIQIPRVMNLVYHDVLGGISPDKQTSERAGDRRSTADMQLQTAVVLSADEAARVVRINHKVLIEDQRAELKFSLPDSWLRLVPTDIVIVQWQGRSERTRLVKVEMQDGYQEYLGLRDRQSSYTSDVQGIPAAPQTLPPNNVVGPTLIEPLDIHILRDTDDGVGLLYYVAVSGVSEAWQGAQVELSFDGGANYVDAETTSVEATMGELMTALEDHPQEFPDEVHTVTVRIDTTNAELLETDLAGMLNGVNRAIIGDEIINFANAVEVSQGMWELSYFLRGRKGSSTEAHPIGTRFVLLDTFTPIPASILDIGRTLTFRATSIGNATDTGTVVSMNYTGRSQIEREVGYLTARRDGVDAIVEWIGTGRLGAGEATAQGARFAGYRVTFDDGVLPPVVVDTMAQELTQDVSALGSPLSIGVVQMNDLTGAGPNTEVTI